jgi:hypothetical protein
MAVDGQVFVQLEDVTSPGYQYALVAISAVTGVAAKDRMVSSYDPVIAPAPQPAITDDGGIVFISPEMQFVAFNGKGQPRTASFYRPFTAQSLMLQQQSLATRS